MDVQTAILSRRTIHAFEPGPIDPAVLDAVLAAAHQAPCHRHTWPWRFTLVGPRTREALAELAVQLKSRNGPLPDAQAAAVRAGVLDPAALVVVSRVLCDDPERAREDHAAVACAVQNLMLSAHGHGVGSKWSTGGVTRAPRTYELLGLDPERVAVEGFVWLGRAARVPPEVRRPPLADVVDRVP